MSTDDPLAARFETDRAHLQDVAYRLLGSLDDAEDAVQAAWLKASQADVQDVRNLTGWFTTVTARECLDQLRARRRRAEVSLADDADTPSFAATPPADEEVILADSVGRALLVVLGRLSPAQRLAFVLHDLFAIPFDEVGQLLDRSPVAAKKLASRARERLHHPPSAQQPSTTDHFKIVEAFLSASQGGDLPTLLNLLAPDVIRRVDRVLVPEGVPTEVRGARDVAEETKMFAARAVAGSVALVNGAPGVVIAPAGQLLAVLRFSVHQGKIHGIDVIGDPQRLANIEVRLPS